MFNRSLSKGCRQFGLINEISDMVSCQRSNISINTDLAGTLQTIIRYKSGVNTYMTAVMVYVNVSSLYSERVYKIYSDTTQ